MSAHQALRVQIRQSHYLDTFVVTPFRGVRVYIRSAMGMPGSETALEELMCRVLGDLLEEGIVIKVADDLYCDGYSPEELLENWKKVLAALQSCDLKLSPSKTTVAPMKTNILGWIWQMGTLRAGPHLIATLTACSPQRECLVSSPLLAQSKF